MKAQSKKKINVETSAEITTLKRCALSEPYKMFCHELIYSVENYKTLGLKPVQIVGAVSALELIMSPSVYSGHIYISTTDIFNGGEYDRASVVISKAKMKAEKSYGSSKQHFSDFEGDVSRHTEEEISYCSFLYMEEASNVLRMAGSLNENTKIISTLRKKRIHKTKGPGL
jgi:hypothetical protein